MREESFVPERAEAERAEDTVKTPVKQRPKAVHERDRTMCAGWDISCALIGVNPNMLYRQRSRSLCHSRCL